MPITFQRRLIIDGSSLKENDRRGWEALVLNLLQQLAKSNTGLCVLFDLHVSIHFVRIVPYPKTDKNADATPTDWNSASYPKRQVYFGDGKAKTTAPRNGTGIGSNVIVEYTPWRFAAVHQAPFLLHELEHAAEEAHGKLFPHPLGWSFDTAAEFDAILVENIYRSEIGLPLRRDHESLTDVLNSELMVPKPEFIRLLRSFRDRMPALTQQLGDVVASYNPLRKGAKGYVGVQGDIPGSTRFM